MKYLNANCQGGPTRIHQAQASATIHSPANSYRMSEADISAFVKVSPYRIDVAFRNLSLIGKQQFLLAFTAVCIKNFQRFAPCILL